MDTIETAYRFDPVVDLPGDVAAICLSFLGVESLLDTAQHVSLAWRRAIDDGLPAVWHEVNEKALKFAHLVTLVKKRHGDIRSFKVIKRKCRDLQQDVQFLLHLHSLSNLRVLALGRDGWFIDKVPELLPHLPLLEDCSIWHVGEVAFPHMQFLHTVYCKRCRLVTGLHNLPALTRLEIRRCTVEADRAWPASLREVAIFHHEKSNLPLVDRIAAMQQLVRLETDWDFLGDRPLFPLIDFPTTLQCFFTRYDHYTPPVSTLYDSIGAMASLRELKLVGLPSTDQELQCLAHLTNLQRITLSDTSRGLMSRITSRSVDLICALPNLESLSIKGCTHISDFSSVGMCSKLTQLAIRTEHKLSLAEANTIAQLQHLRKLKLAIRNDDPAVISVLFSINSLTSISVHACGLKRYDAACFASMPNMSLLESVKFYGIIADTSSFADGLLKLPRLKRVRLTSASTPSKRYIARLRAESPHLEWGRCIIDGCVVFGSDIVFC